MKYISIIILIVFILILIEQIPPGPKWGIIFSSFMKSKPLKLRLVAKKEKNDDISSFDSKISSDLCP